MDAAAYAAQLAALLPSGRAWPREPGSVLEALLAGQAEEFARVHGRALDLLAEVDPRATLELLPDWERLLGLPDACAGAADEVDERRARVLAKLLARGGQSIAYFQALAESLGLAVTISEYAAMTCESACDVMLNPDPWCYAWRVHTNLDRISNLAVTDACADPLRTWAEPYVEWVDHLDCGGTCAEPLRSWGDPFLECLVRRWAPAHTAVIFTYDEEEL